ncbi:hypothetical protein [Bacillus sp. FSL R9-9410]|uniref:hypothetical protein n=1 Tax=Bacillus sp. FSL R9-9410 TaxID=2921590 RepID=UPI003100F8A8
MYNITNGRYMTQNEVQETLKQAVEQQDFQTFISEVSLRQQIDVEKLEIKFGYMFDILEVEPPTVNVVKSILLQNKEKNVQLSIVAYNKVGDTHINYDFSADYKTEVSVKQITLNKALELSQEPTVTVSTVEDVGQFEMLDGTVPYNDPNYAPGESIENLNTKDLMDGCLAGYNHCGKSCGDGGSTGGGTPINPVDSCCRAHDRCYDMYGFDKCSCDRVFGDCVRPYKGKYTMANAILAWISVKYCRN